MQVVNGGIQIFLSVEEANILEQALSRYDGPYSRVEGLAPHEVDRHDRMITTAGAMLDAIRDELSRQHYAAMSRLI